MSEFKDKVRFEGVRALRLTNNGNIVCAFPEQEAEVVVPDSQVDDDSEVWRVGDEGVLVVSEWWATQRGFV